MKFEKAIEIKSERIAELQEASKHKMSMYQRGHISKEQHNEIQSALNRSILAERLGIEALERIREAREQAGYLKLVNLIEKPLPSETES